MDSDSSKKKVLPKPVRKRDLFRSIIMDDEPTLIQLRASTAKVVQKAYGVKWKYPKRF